MSVCGSIPAGCCYHIDLGHRGACMVVPDETPEHVYDRLLSRRIKEARSERNRLDKSKKGTQLSEEELELIKADVELSVQTYRETLYLAEVFA